MAKLPERLRLFRLLSEQSMIVSNEHLSALSNVRLLERQNNSVRAVWFVRSSMPSLLPLHWRYVNALLFDRTSSPIWLLEQTRVVRFLADETPSDFSLLLETSIEVRAERPEVFRYVSEL